MPTWRAKQRRPRGQIKDDTPAAARRFRRHRSSWILLREPGLGGCRPGPRPHLPGPRGAPPAWLVEALPHRRVPLLQPQPGVADNRPGRVHHLPIRPTGSSESSAVGLGPLQVP